LNDGIVVSGTPQTEGSRWIAITENDILAGKTRGILMVGSVGNTLVAGNRISGCSQAGIQVTDLAPSAGSILFANNTVRTSGMSFRYWGNELESSVKAGQVRLLTNLFLEAMHVDVGYVKRGAGDQATPGPGKDLAERWHWRGNVRDMSGMDVAYLVPLAPGDRRLTPSELAPSLPGQEDIVRPRQDGPLAKPQPGKSELGLPGYVGAVPPEGTRDWDWTISWRSLMRTNP
jgi:parallel beta-helix repeat protein